MRCCKSSHATAHPLCTFCCQSGVALARFLPTPNFWFGPLVSVAMAIILVIVLFNLLIAVMSEVPFPWFVLRLLILTPISISLGV